MKGREASLMELWSVPAIVFLLASIALVFACILAQARSAIAPETVARALAQRGIVVGAGTVIDGVPWQIASMRVESAGDWVVVRILPRRLP